MLSLYIHAELPNSHILFTGSLIIQESWFWKKKPFEVNPLKIGTKFLY